MALYVRLRLFADSRVCAPLHRCTLLDRMRELVGNQLLATRALRLEFVSTEEDVLADSESIRAKCFALFSSGLIGVNADIPEVRTESGLHLTAYGCRQGGAG